MKWQAPALCGFAESAGFAGDAVPLAVAVALGASDGVDNHLSRPWGGSQTAYVGLWQLPVVGGDDDAIYRLCDPQSNAQDALRRYSDDGDTFLWCIGYQTGRWRQFMHAATVAYRASARADVQVQFGTTET